MTAPQHLRAQIVYGQQKPYRIVQIYGAWVILRVLIDEDAAPKLRQVEQVGETHATEQRAEAEMQRLIESPREAGEPRACESCGTVKPTSEFYRRGDDWQRHCKVCQSEHFSAYRQKRKRLKPEPKLARARA